MSDLERVLQRGYRYALALTADPQEAEDLLQEGWSAVLKANGPRTAGYLCRAIRSRWVDQLRRGQVVQFEALEEPDTVAALPGPLDRFAHRDVWRALDTLRPEEREALYLCVVEGHTAREVAEHTGRPRNTILSLLHRGRAKLRAWFEDNALEVVS